MKILVVDDSISARKITIRILKEMNHTDILEAADGILALEQVRNHPDIQVIMLDRYMPNMDGLEFLKQFRELPASKTVFVAMVTAETDQQEMVKTIMDFQPDYYITKPVTQQAVMRMFAEMAEKKN